MPFLKEDKEKIIKEFGGNEKNTGSTEVQIALLTSRIQNLTTHFEAYKKDHNSRRGLMKLVGQRRKLLKYLKRINLECYRTILKQLNLRK